MLIDPIGPRSKRPWFVATMLGRQRTADLTTKLGTWDLGFGIRDQLFAPTIVPYPAIIRLQYNAQVN